MPQILDPTLVALINSRQYAALQTPRRNSGNSSYEWGTPIWSDGSYADPTWITSLASSKITGLGSLSLLSAAPAGTLTGTTLAATVVTSSLTAVGTLATGSVPYSLVTGGPSGANPSVSVGLAAVNGSASTFLRSDGAPALSQAIVPTWTGLHTFQAATSGKAAVFNAAATTPGNITEWQSSAAGKLAAVLPAGTIEIYPSIAATAQNGFVMYRGASQSTVALRIGLTVDDEIIWNTANASTSFQVNGITKFKIPSTSGGFGMLVGSVSTYGTLTLAPSDVNQTTLSFNNITNTTQQAYIGLTAAGYQIPGTADNDFFFNNTNKSFVFSTNSGTASHFKIGIGGATSVSVSSASVVGLTVKAAPSQSANLQEFQNSAGTILASVGSGERIGARSGIDLTSTLNSGPVSLDWISSGFASFNASGNTPKLSLVATTVGTVARFTVNINSTTDNAACVQLNADSADRKVLVVQGFTAQSVALLQLQTSAGASLGNVGGTIFNSFTDTSTTSVDGTENDLYSYTVAANTLGVNGDSLYEREHIQFVASATATRRLKKYFAGTLIFDSGSLTLSVGGDFFLETTIIRESSTVVRVSVNVVTTSASSVPYATYTRITGLTLSGTNILKTTGIAAGVGAASGDIVNKLAKMKWESAA